MLGHNHLRAAAAARHDAMEIDDIDIVEHPRRCRLRQEVQSIGFRGNLAQCFYGYRGRSLIAGYQAAFKDVAELICKRERDTRCNNILTL